MPFVLGVFGIKFRNVQITSKKLQSLAPGIKPPPERSTSTSSFSAFPCGTFVTSYHFTLSNISGTLLHVGDLNHSLAPAPARPEHNSWLPCSDWIWYFHVVLETAFPPTCSQCRLPPSSIPFDLDTVFFFRSRLRQQLCCIAHFRTNWLLYVLLCSLEQSVLVLSSPPSPLSLLSLSYTPYLMAALPSSLPQFLFCLLNNYMFINRGSPGSWERDISDGARGLAEVPCYRGSFIDKPASLPCPQEQPRGAACWWG